MDLLSEGADLAASKEVEESTVPDEGGQPTPEKRGLSKWRMEIVIIALTLSIAIVTVTGPVVLPVLDYHGEVDFNLSDLGFTISSTASAMTMEQTTHPNYGGFIVFNSTSDSLPLLILDVPAGVNTSVTNASGTVVLNSTHTVSIFTALSDIAFANSYWWTNFSGVPSPFRIDIYRESERYLLNYSVNSTVATQMSWVQVSAHFQPGSGVPRVDFQADNVSLQLSNGTTASFSGPAHVSVARYVDAYVNFLTRFHAFPFIDGETLEWSNGNVSMTEVSGVAIPSQGNQRRFSNATVTTPTTPLTESFAFQFDQSTQESHIGYTLGSSTLRVEDATGATIVGQSSQDLLQAPFGLSDGSKAGVLIALTGLLAAVTSISNLRRR